MLRVILDENNDFPPGGPALGDGVESARTALQATFGTQQDEWAYELPFGMPWRSAVFGKFFDSGATRAIMSGVANTVPDIEPTTPAQVSFDTTSNADFRQVDVTFTDVVVGETIDDIEITTTV